MASISFHTDSEITSIGYNKEGFDATCLSINVTHRLSKDLVYSCDWLLLHGTAESHRAFAQAILDATEGKDVRVEQVSILPPEITPEPIPHVPAIVHRSGGVPATERNVCGRCGETIRRNWDVPGGEWVGIASETANCITPEPETPFDLQEKL